MTQLQLIGLLVVIVAGLCIGFAPLPLKHMRRFQYEHWAFVSMLSGLVVIPWAITLAACPHPWTLFRSVGASVLIKGNLFSIGWGIANLLYLQCLVRIGVSLTSGIIGGLTIALGVFVPMVFKGSGVFGEAPAINSPAGWTLLSGIAVALLGAFVAARAGAAREKWTLNRSRKTGQFSVGLAMAITAGFLGSGISLAFVYSQGPIVAAMKARGAGDVSAAVSVWAVALLGGALTNVLYPAYLMTRTRSWAVLSQSPGEIVLALLFGTAFIAGFSLMGRGMLLLGALGASVGFGVQQSVQMLSNQAIGFVSGEWRDSSASPMYGAIGLLMLAIGILSVGNFVGHI